MNRIIVWLCLLAGLPTMAQPADLTVKLPARGTFVVYGDTRFTDPADHTRSNPDVRQALVQQVAADDPAFIAIAGDLVLDATAADWRVYEQETGAWRKRQIPVLPALGNHDLHGPDALSLYFHEFPQLGNRRWYSVRAGSVLLLFLDSNLDDSPGSEQGRWLDAQLRQVPEDVDFVLLVMHHPVYTQSGDDFLGGGHSVRPSEQHLATLLEERQKTLHARLLVFSGHVHNYERYQRGGVMYVVSGGGGAPPYAVRRSPSDFYTLPEPNYHYCRLRLAGRTLSVEMVRMEGAPGSYTARVRDAFQLSAKPGSQAAHAH